MPHLQARWNSASPSTRTGQGGEEHAAFKYYSAEKGWPPARYVVLSWIETAMQNKLWIGAVGLIGGGAFVWGMYAAGRDALQ